MSQITLTSYSFNRVFKTLENVDTCLIVNTNPRHDATLLMQVK